MIIVMNEKMRKTQLFIELFTISKFSLSIAMRSAVLPVKCITLTFEIALGPESGLSDHKYHIRGCAQSFGETLPPYPRLRDLCTTPFEYNRNPFRYWVERQ